MKWEKSFPFIPSLFSHSTWHHSVNDSPEFHFPEAHLLFEFSILMAPKRRPTKVVSSFPFLSFFHHINWISAFVFCNRQKGESRMDAALDAMHIYGFSKQLVRATVKSLLKVTESLFFNLNFLISFDCDVKNVCLGLWWQWGLGLHRRLQLHSPHRYSSWKPTQSFTSGNSASLVPYSPSNCVISIFFFFCFLFAVFVV